MMQKKNCLFCNELVPIEAIGGYDRFFNCFCSPGGYYHLLRDSHSTIQSFSYPRKRELFPIVSAYIREQTDCNERVFLTLEDMDKIPNDASIPASLEDKEARLLQFLHRNTEAPYEAVVLHPLLQHHNLTYSPNLQEFIYIIERLRNQQHIIREGGTLKLTEQGWRTAAARAGGPKNKPCLLFLSSDEQHAQQWSDTVMFKAEQLGYKPLLAHELSEENSNMSIPELILESKLIIADVTQPLPDLYFAAGYAFASNIPVLLTMKHSRGEPISALPLPLQPVLWDTAEELSEALTYLINNQKSLLAH